MESCRWLRKIAYMAFCHTLKGVRLRALCPLDNIEHTVYFHFAGVMLSPAGKASRLLGPDKYFILGVRMKRIGFLSLLISLSCVTPAFANSIDFEGLPDSTSVGSTYASLGVVFDNATVRTAGISLNAGFPPSSGVNVVGDMGGPIMLTFATPVSSFSGRFTYTQSLILNGFDSLFNPVAAANSLFDVNSVSSGNPANELIALNFGGGINFITITGDRDGGSFTLDDVNFTPIQVVSVPEPDMISLLVLCVAGLAVCVYSRRTFVKRLP